MTAPYSVVLSVTGSSKTQPLPFLLLLLTWGLQGMGGEEAREGFLEKGGVAGARPRVGRQVLRTGNIGKGCPDEA